MNNLGCLNAKSEVQMTETMDMIDDFINIIDDAKLVANSASEIHLCIQDDLTGCQIHLASVYWRVTQLSTEISKILRNLVRSS